MQLRSLLLAGFIGLGLINAAPLHAATLTGGDLIKTANLPDVYYYGNDAKRYVFPNEKTYFSWYIDFNLKTISADELAAVSIGGAVTYRPGSRMVKLTTDPKVYAIAKNGTLRWIQTEQIAIQLYGNDWAKKIDDLPDTLMATYKIGLPIVNASDYSPSAELAAASSISIDKNLQTPSTTPPALTPPPTPTPTSTSNLIFSLSKPTLKAGDVETMTAYATSISGLVKLDIFFDGELIKTCMIATCVAEKQIPISGTKSQYETKAIATTVSGATETQTRTITVSNQISTLATLRIGRAIIKPNQAGEAVVESDISIAVLRTDIYINGESIEACASSVRICAWSDILTGAVSTTYDVYGKVTDTLGRTYQTPHKTITIGTNDSPIVTIITGKDTIFSSESVDITVTGSDDDGIKSIEVLANDTVIKTCLSAAPCTAISGPWSTPGTVIFRGRVTDSLGLTSYSEPSNVQVQ